MNHSHIYLGVYVECKNEITELPVLRRHCKNPECSHARDEYSMDKIFCPFCGCAMNSFCSGYEELSSVDWVDVSEEIDELLNAAILPGRDIWMPNISTERPVEVEINVDDEFTTEIEPNTDTRHIVNFRSQFAKEIEALDRHYGPDNVKMRWGVVNYWR